MLLSPIKWCNCCLSQKILTWFNKQVKLFYITTNEIKFGAASEQLVPHNIELQQEGFDFSELQSENPEEIVRDKARQAFEYFQTPVLVSDDCWQIPALRGFPGPYMKQLNSWFAPEDWLRLMTGMKDRRIFLLSSLAYQDAETCQVFSHTRTYYFLEQPDLAPTKAPHLQVISKKPDGISVAKELELQGYSQHDPKGFWSGLADWLKNRHDVM